MFIVLYGIQGSGKGTQGGLLSRKLSIPHLSTGEVLRAIASEPSDEGKRIKATIESGQYLSDTEMTTILKRHLPPRVILDGYPRTIAQARLLDTIENVDSVLYIDLDKEEAMRRALARGRADDTPDAITNRIAQYRADADGILNYYRAQGKLVEVDGGKAIPIVFDEICAKLNI